MNIDPDYVRIFDTTLRDGEQSPGATMTSGEKLEVARALALLGVDVIEAGFPAASPDDLAAVKAVAEVVGGAPLGDRTEPPIVCALARANERDIDKAWEALQSAARPRIHTFIATSPIHREHKLRMSKEEIVAKVKEMVSYARAKCEDVEFSAEDAGRTEPEYLHEVVQVAIEAGATTINIPDTVGYTTPDEFGALIKGIKDNVADIGKAIISVHCHNDLGLATANTLAAIANGARQAECTINGIGERAGNTSLEEIVMTLRTRHARFGLETGIDTRRIHRTSKLISTVTGMVVQPNKAIVGANAFAHEAGIHQDGMLKHGSTYEIMRPEDVGVPASRLVLGKHSGRHALGVRLKELGYPLGLDDLEKTFLRFKNLADRKKQITDADLVALVSAQLQAPSKPHFVLDGIQITAGSIGMPTATVRLVNAEGDELITAAVGTGPVDAAFKAIDQLTGTPVTLLEYNVSAVTEGIDALGEVTVRVVDDAQEAKTRAHPQSGQQGRRVFHGHSAETDVLVASAKAYLGAINRVLDSRIAASGAARAAAG